MIPTQYYLILSAILFGLGAVAFVVKRNIITIFMSIELMLNAVNLIFATFARMHASMSPQPAGENGQIFALFIIAVAAAEATGFAPDRVRFDASIVNVYTPESKLGLHQDIAEPGRSGLRIDRSAHRQDSESEQQQGRQGDCRDIERPLHIDPSAGG